VVCSHVSTLTLPCCLRVDPRATVATEHGQQPDEGTRPELPEQQPPTATEEMQMDHLQAADDEVAPGDDARYQREYVEKTASPDRGSRRSSLASNYSTVSSTVSNRYSHNWSRSPNRSPTRRRASSPAAIRARSPGSAYPHSITGHITATADARRRSVNLNRLCISQLPTHLDLASAGSTVKALIAFGYGVIA
jgi:hypothetical protein